MSWREEVATKLKKSYAGEILLPNKVESNRAKRKNREDRKMDCQNPKENLWLFWVFKMEKQDKNYYCGEDIMNQINRTPLFFKINR